MSLALRPPTPADYGALASWIPDAPACLRWAGSGVPFPFDAAALPQLLAVPDSESHCLARSMARRQASASYGCAIRTPCG